MRQGTRDLLIAAILVAALGGCSKGAEKSLPPLGAEAISPETLWKRIGEESPYRRYASWPGQQGIQMGQAPHGGQHRIFISRAIAEALPIAGRTVPAGGIIVMENLNSESRLTGISVMAKVVDIDPKNNDWFWASFDPNGKATDSGSVRTCIGCHAGMKDNDFVIVRRLDAPLD